MKVQADRTKRADAAAGGGSKGDAGELALTKFTAQLDATHASPLTRVAGLALAGLCCLIGSAAKTEGEKKADREFGGACLMKLGEELQKREVQHELIRLGEAWHALSREGKRLPAHESNAVAGEG